MSDYSATFPSQRPVFSQDFSNGSKIDPRATFSRSDTPPTYAAPSAVHYWSNEKHLSSDNLLLQSSDFDTTWTPQGLNATPTSGQTDPSGGTSGFTLVESNTSNAHRVTQQVTASGDLALTVYAKQNSGSRYLLLKIYNAEFNWEVAVFDLAGGAAATNSGSSSTFTSVSTSQTASGNGYYKCVIAATGTANSFSVALKDASNASGLAANYGSRTYIGDGTSSIDVAFASLSTTGSTDYNATTTQIHREYAPTLKSVATAGQPRFEYDPATDGQSIAKGILIEGQSTNLVTYSETLATGWTETRCTLRSNVGVAPDGTLTSNLFEVDGSAGLSHNIRFDFTTGGATPQTASIYAKAGSLNYLIMRLSPTNGAFADGWVSFNLSNGTVGTTNGSMTSSSIESCGNGWYRCSITKTALVNATGRVVIYAAQADDTLAFDGNSYDHIQVWGGQIEANQSFSSSYIKSNSGSTTTRALESLSMTDSSLFSGNEGTIAFEGQTLGGSTGFGRFWTVSDGTNDNRIHVYPTSSTAVRFRVYRNGIEQRNVASGVTDVTQSNRYAFAYEDNKLRLAQNGSLITDDSNSVVMPVVDKLSIGINAAANSNSMNGHVKRIAFYNQSLSDTEMAALSS